MIIIHIMADNQPLLGRLSDRTRTTIAICLITTAATPREARGERRQNDQDRPPVPLRFAVFDGSSKNTISCPCSCEQCAPQPVLSICAF